MKGKRVKKDRSATIVPEVVDGGTYSELVGAIGELLERARERIATTANTALVETYWNTGRYIVEYEQHGADRAKYGSELLSHLTRDLTLKYGKGYGKSNLVYMRKLYRAFPKGMTLSYQLSWSHYLEILKCSDELEIGFYVAECVRSNWNVRELRRQMKSSSSRRRGHHPMPRRLASCLVPKGTILSCNSRQRASPTASSLAATSCQFGNA